MREGPGGARRRGLLHSGRRTARCGNMALFRRKAQGASPARAQISRDVTARVMANPAVHRARVEKADIYHCPDFLDARECRALIDLIDAGRRPSTLLSTSYVANFRTSDSCDLDRTNPFVSAIDHRVADLLGIAADKAETLQGQRYAPGQQFRAHYDWFNENEHYWEAMKASGGQRTWTAMIYLNDVEEGGATWFPNAGTRVAPKRGLLLAWNNMRMDGVPNIGTLHEGTPVVRGTKYIVTKWFREHPWVGAGSVPIHTIPGA